jgi:hypothetical protein
MSLNQAASSAFPGLQRSHSTSGLSVTLSEGPATGRGFRGSEVRHRPSAPISYGTPRKQRAIIPASHGNSCRTPHPLTTPLLSRCPSTT